ncbi:hypothetical protein KFK09_013800 [Dendrobium nobile]|uniref:GAG-pre-integrase domain-containing protein n=1 Tax=Dendrobium nobile TaxID=94219 RepID=A0A8T3B8A9_DENNO|nr:hypothetical protein KFK09_013800 [Dendrobium nobile]
MANTASSSFHTEATSGVLFPAQSVSPSLKFVISNLKFLVPNPLTPDNYPLWSNQIIKILKANGFALFLDPKPTTVTATATLANDNTDSNQESHQWSVIDQNLAAALCSTISPAVLPYVIQLNSTHEIWSTLQTRFQSSNRSKVIQLKNELHNVSMKNLSMSQYLTEIKKIVDQIASAGSTVDSEDVMIYILNGLPPSYQPFAASIRTMQTSLTLDNLYALLISEEIHLQAAATKFPTSVDTQTALYASNYRGRRGRSRPSQEKIQTTRSVPSSGVICQICKKKGHSAEACWHRLNPNYIPSQPSNKNSQALLANTDTNNSTDWYLDSGASTHMTNSTDNLATSNVYTGTDKVTLGDGRSVPIAHSGTGLLPTPSRKLFLSQLLHTPISHNLLSISNLVKDNNISIIFDSSGFIFKDLTTNRILLRGPCKDGLYRIAKPVHQTQHTGLSVARTSSSQWHNRLGHPSHRILQHISKNNPDLHISSTSISCNPCNQCK